jgi:hypothetical protein
MTEQIAGTMQVLAPAKINLSLKILGRRNDGFHELDTLIAPISLYDEIRIDKRRPGKGIEFRCDDASIPQGNENLAVRAAKAFFDTTKIEPAVSIELRKKIPHGAGLGGGSSDAASVLRNSHAREIAEAVFDPVVETGFCGLNSMGLLTLATFSRDSGNSLPSAGIRRANFRERSRTSSLRKICLPGAIKDVAAQSIGSWRGADVGFRFNSVCGGARKYRCGFCGDAGQS